VRELIDSARDASSLRDVVFVFRFISCCRISDDNNNYSMAEGNAVGECLESPTRRDTNRNVGLDRLVIDHFVFLWRYLMPGAIRSSRSMSSREDSVLTVDLPQVSLGMMSVFDSFADHSTASLDLD
jgi:hypothetical protein